MEGLTTRLGSLLEGGTMLLWGGAILVGKHDGRLYTATRMTG